VRTGRHAVVTCVAFPDNFNASYTNNTQKNRSDDKGPEQVK
jgi:hypothetical protein